MAKIVYQRDERGFAQVARSSGMQAMVRDAADSGLEFAQDIAPVRDTGDYKASLTAWAGEESARGNVRPAGYIGDNVAYGARVEAAHHVLARTADFIEAGG